MFWLLNKSNQNFDQSYIQQPTEKHDRRWYFEDEQMNLLL